jgi:hypothetical protein
MRGNRLELIPALQATMSFNCAFDQGIHCRVS